MDDDKQQEDREATPVVDWSSSPSTEPRPWDTAKVRWGEAAPPPPPSRTAIAPPPAPEPEPEPEPTSDAQPAKPSARKGPGRSPLGILALLALTGYLSWVAAMCYDNLGALHRQADRATPSEIADLQGQHAAATHQLRDGCNQVNQKDGKITHPHDRNDRCQPGKTAKTSGSMR